MHSLNPRARIVRAAFSKVPLDRVLDTGLFDFEQAAQAPGWLRELRGEHMPETEEYGIASFVYRARRPFHPKRFHALIDQDWPGVVRSKGYFWLATRPELAGSWSQAGPVVRHEFGGVWWAAVPKKDWPQEPDALAVIRGRWQEPHGDAQQELVMIGMDMDEATLRRRLDACLLSDAELALGEDGWREMEDPFPRWTLDDEDALA